MANKTFIQKFILCFLTGTIGAFAISEVSRKLLPQWTMIITAIAVLCLISAIIFVFAWHYREKRKQINSETIFIFWQCALRYFIAIDLSMFAWRKIFLLQFYAPQALLDKTVSSLTGEQLMITFFSYSYPLGLGIAIAQLFGSILLLFRKTTLLGVFILLPVITNIVLFDLFYNVHRSVLLMSIALLLGLFYLLLCDFEKVKTFFFSAKENMSSFNFLNNFLKTNIRVSAIVIPLTICVLLYDFPNRHPDITGKFKVQKLTINRTDKDLTNCKDSVLTTIYIDDNNDIVFENNSPNNWQVGHFSYNKNSRQLKVIWRYPKTFHDTLSATLSKLDKEYGMILTGIMGNDTISANLLKVK
jgi:hypothetical protein